MPVLSSLEQVSVRRIMDDSIFLDQENFHQDKNNPVDT